MEEQPLFDIRHLQDRDRRELNKRIIRAACRSVYVGGNEVLCRVLGRFPMYVEGGDVSIGQHMILNGFWEMHVTEALAKAVEPGMTVVDVGANCGYFTLVMGHLAGKQGRCIAIEASPVMMARLAKTLRAAGMFPRCSLHEVAVCDESGQEIDLHVAAVSPMNAKIGDPPGGKMAALETHRVQSSTLDDCLEGQRVDVMKVDIEGAEESMWAGAQETLARSPDIVIVMEVNSRRYRDAGAFYRSIRNAGFPLRYLDARNGVVDCTVEELATTKGLKMLYLTRR